ncbi:MAG: hypothetical protein LKM36_12170 [Flavobacteriales bacterium]|jgi:hypothetical protein|nr:hypothetical protein [Flavobacteriales bacterium]
MTKQAIIERTIGAINKLPQEKAEEVLDFVILLLKRHDEQSLTVGLHHLASTSKTFDFLNEEEDLYTLADLKKVYNG